MKEPTPSTAGSLRITSDRLCCSVDMAGKDTSGAASVRPMMRPVSSSGTKPFGVVLNSSTVSPIVSSITSTMTQGWRRATRRVRA